MSRSLKHRIYILIAMLVVVSSSVYAGPKLHRVYRLYDASYGLADNGAQTIHCTRTGRMIITTIGHVNFYDGASFIHIDPQPENVFTLSKYTGHYRSFFDKHHHFWVKDKGAVTCLNLHSERFETNIDSIFHNMGMPLRVEDLFSDVDNHLWALSGNQLHCMDTKQTFPIRHQAELQDVDVFDRKHLLEFFANGVVSVYNIKTGQHLYDACSLNDEDTVKYSVSSVICANGSDYYQIRNGKEEAVLLHFSAKTHQWRTLMSLPYHMNNMTILKGKLYVASEQGYWVYYLKSGRTKHFESFALPDGRTLFTDVNDICFDRQGGMWLGTEKRGLLYSSPFKMPFNIYDKEESVYIAFARMMEKQSQTPGSLPRHVNCVYTDSRGWQWTGTYTGLQLQKSKGAPVKIISQRDGLRNDMVHSVIEDHQHNIWVATSFGISHLYISGDSVRHIQTYIDQDNVPTESFVDGRAMKLDDGTIAMQALDHMVVFHPSNFYEEQIEKLRLVPKLIRLMVNGHFVNEGTEIDGEILLYNAVSRLRDLTVNYDQNTLSLTFSGLNYIRPVQTYYRVRVKGLSDKWHVYSYANSAGRVDSRGMFHLTMTALPPGYYTIELQASMSPDVWLQEPEVWRIHVKQPWWRSTGIYIVLGLLIIILVLLNAYFFVRNMRLRFMRSDVENSMLRQVKNFSVRCVSMSEDVSTSLTAIDDDIINRMTEQEHEFERKMLAIVPYVYEHRNETLTMQQLAKQISTSKVDLYEVLMYYVYKSPRLLAKKLREQKSGAESQARP